MTVMDKVVDTFDYYEISARLAPTFIVISPLILLIAIYYESLKIASLEGLIFLVSLYLFSFIVRQLGLKRQDALWKKLGGSPSTLILGTSDSTFSFETKTKIRNQLRSVFASDHINSQVNDDDIRYIDDIFVEVRGYLRIHDPKGLWVKHNAEYGFIRNLFGAWWLWLFNDIAVIGLLSFLFRASTSVKQSAFLVIAVIILFIIISLRIFFFKRLMTITSIRYAESAWTSFLSLSLK